MIGWRKMIGCGNPGRKWLKLNKYEIRKIFLEETQLIRNILPPKGA